MPHRSDEELFATFVRRRDCQALGVLFRRRADELLRLAVFLAPRPTDAEDLVQATFLSAIARAETFHHGSRVMSWLRGILTNHARMLRRAERRAMPAAAPECVDEQPFDAALRSEVRAALAQAIAALPEPYRSVMALHLHDGLDSQEISRRLARPPATVRKQIERALDRLRAALPLGLATAFLVRVNAAQIAANAADAARFVDVDPIAAPAPAPAALPGPTSGLALRLALALLAVAALSLVARPTVAEEADGERVPHVAPAQQATAGSSTARTAPATLEDAAATPRELAPAAVAVLAVTATTLAGEPLPGLLVQVVHDDERSLPERLLCGEVAEATTDAEGRATFAGLRAARCEIVTPGALPHASLRLAPGGNEATIRLPEPMPVAVLVTGPDGMPLPGAEVLVSETSGRGDTCRVLGTTRADGRCEATVALRRGRVFARHPSFAPSIGARLERDRTLHLQVGEARRTVAVTCVDDAGRPLADCFVAIAPRSRGTDLLTPSFARSDAAGRCAFGDPGDVEATVVGSRGDLAPATVDLAPEATTAVLRFGRGGMLRGTAIGVDGEPLAGREVVVSMGEQRSNEPVGPLVNRCVHTGVDGSFVLDRLPAARLQVRIHGAAGAAGGMLPNAWILAGADVEIAAGGTSVVELRARVHAELPGLATTPDGLPLANWQVVAVPTSGTAFHRLARARSVRTGDDGSFVLRGLGREDCVLGVYEPEAELHGDAVQPLLTAHARPGGEPCRLVVDTATRPNGSLSCRVLGPDGRPCARATLELRRTDLQCPATRAAAEDGSCEFDALPAGEYWLAVVAPGLGTRTVAVRIDDGPTDLGAIRLRLAARLVVQVGGAQGASGLRVVARHEVGDKFVESMTDTRGIAVLPPLPPGPTALLVHGPGAAPIVQRVDLVAGPQWLDVQAEPASGVDVSFVFAQADNPYLIDGPLRVQVHGEDGVLAWEDYVGAAVAPGRFRFATGLAPGRYRIVATSLWNATATVEVAVGQGPGAATVELLAPLVP